MASVRSLLLEKMQENGENLSSIEESSLDREEVDEQLDSEIEDAIDFTIWTPDSIYFPHTNGREYSIERVQRNPY